MTLLAPDARQKTRPLADALFALAELACEQQEPPLQLRDAYEVQAVHVQRAVTALWLGVERALQDGMPWLRLFDSLRDRSEELNRAVLADLSRVRRQQRFELAPPRGRGVRLVLLDTPARRVARLQARLVKATAALELTALSAWLGEGAAINELVENLTALLTAAGVGAPRTSTISGCEPSLFNRLLREQSIQSGRVPKQTSAARPLQADDLSFTVFRPRQLLANQWTRLLAFAHLSERRPDAPADAPDPLAEVRAQAHALLGAAAAGYREAREDAGQPIPFEGQLTLVPHVPGVEFDPPEQSFRWLTDMHREEFQMRASPELIGTSARGSLAVYYGSILIADLTLSIPVVRQLQPLTGTDPVSQSARLYRKIFASYSHRDAHTVSMFAKLVRAFGDDYLIDQDKLRAGQCWSEALQALIREADVFQLFWSSQSMHSPFVQKEWEYALSLGKPNFVRPTYWETPLPEGPGLPPPALKALHFQKIPHFSAQAVAPPPAATATLAPAPEVDVPAPMPARPRGLKPAFSAGLGTLAFLLVGVWSIRNTFVDEPTSQPLPPVVAEPTPPFVPAPPIHVIKPKPETVDPPPHAGSTEASPSYPLSSSEVLPNTIELTSDPSGAEVHLNGVTLGVTPLRMPRAQARGKVVVKLEGYVPTARQLGPDQRTNVRIRLVPRHIAVEF